ncbi:hypothetical protein BCV71DRAFT_251376 [Rhizopus microsporus]|uniref:GATA-type domain-containing protein n=1 Tax=Rhizopus microsporus TaxID=58291 RepID=A0A1X0RQX4_RHIZD|nr:hypothetical protein BCV71DRAFT_251376 [Rhizopus microsporus]
MSSACFWAILSVDNFRFIYVSDITRRSQIKDRILDHSLLNFIHPEELPLAKADLLHFMKIKSLAGAVTRYLHKCRLNKITEEHNQEWIITDIVMYPATSRTLLTFFHDCHQGLSLFNVNEMKQTIENYMTPTFLDHLFRIFQVYDSSTYQLLASWPLLLDHLKRIIQTPDMVHHPLYSQEAQRQFIEDVSRLTQTMIMKEINSGHLSQPRLGCCQHIYSNSTVTLDPLGLCDVESIIIYFGPIVFATFQITPVHSQSYHRSNVQSEFRRLPSIHELLNGQISLTSPKVPKIDDNILQQQLMSSYGRIGANNSSGISSSSSSSSSSGSSSISNSKDNNNHDRSSSSITWKGKFIAQEKRCEYCRASTSPEWRKGPSGHKTLCNACGLRYARFVAKYEKQQHISNNDEPVRLSSPQKKKKL